MTGTVAKRSKNISSVLKRKMKFEIKNGSGVSKRKTRIETNSVVDYVWNAGEMENMSKNSTSNKSLGVGLGVIGVNYDVDCTTNIYMRRSKLPRTSMIGMGPDGEFVTVSGCEDEVFGDDPDVLPCVDVPVFETKPCEKNEMMVTLATNARGQEAVIVQDSECGMRVNVEACEAREASSSSTNVRGTWLSRVGGLAKPGTGPRGSSPSSLRRTSRSTTSTGISKSRRTTTLLGGRGTSSPSGTQRRAVSTTSGVQSLISWASQLGELGKQTKLQAKPVLSNRVANTASQESDSVDSLPGQAEVRRCTNKEGTETRNWN